MKYIASVSFGKDSLAMLLKLLEEQRPLDYVVFYNTGMEFQCIYNNRDRISKILPDSVQYVELSPPRPFLYDMLEKPVNKRDGTVQQGYSWCGGVARWGTKIKTRTIEKFKTSLKEEVIDYIGIALDEPNRITNDPNKLYPLVEYGMTEKDCLEYCYSKGYNWLEEDIELYSILDRVSCYCCANKNRKELKNMYQYLPTYWNKLKCIQSQTKRPMKKYIKKGIPYGNVFDMEKVFKAEIEGEKQ